MPGINDASKELTFWQRARVRAAIRGLFVLAGVVGVGSAFLQDQFNHATEIFTRNLPAVKAQRAQLDPNAPHNLVGYFNGKQDEDRSALAILLLRNAGIDANYPDQLARLFVTGEQADTMTYLAFQYRHAVQTGSTDPFNDAVNATLRKPEYTSSRVHEVTHLLNEAAGGRTAILPSPDEPATDASVKPQAATASPTHG